MGAIIILIVTIVLGLFGVGVAVDSGCPSESGDCTVEGTQAAWMRVSVNGIDGVIVPAEDASAFVTAEVHWTPTEDEVARAEDAIAKEHGELGHMRQYAGFVQGGDRKIYVNGFASDTGIDWSSQPVMVEDGGEAFFQAVYNVETGALEWFSFNGEA